MGTDPHSSRGLTGPRPSAIARQIGQRNAGGRRAVQASSGPSPLQRADRGARVRGCNETPSGRWDYARTRCQRCVTTASRGTRPRARWWHPRSRGAGNARTGREGWAGAIADQLRDHCHPARVYRSRVALAGARRLRSPVRASRISRFGSQTISLGDGVRWAPSTGAQVPAPGARRLRRSTELARACKPCTSLRRGQSPRA